MTLLLEVMALEAIPDPDLQSASDQAQALYALRNPQNLGESLDV